MHFVRTVVGSLIFCLGSFVSAAKGDSVKAVNAADYGWNPIDATPALQAAIDSGSERVLVPKMPSDWRVKMIHLTNNQEIVFEHGTVVTAIEGAFQDWKDYLFYANQKTNITLRGYGATLRMQKSEYVTGEHRHVLNLRECKNITVLGLALCDSGGDGLYVGSLRPGGYCEDILIEDVICRNNKRQGISVTGAKNVTIANSVFLNTWGIAPEASIDFEPNFPTQPLSDCIVRNCYAENARYGFIVDTSKFNSESAPVSVRFENCAIKHMASYGMVFMARGTTMPVTAMSVENARISGIGGAGVFYCNTDSKVFSGYFANSLLANCGLTYRAPFYFQSDQNVERLQGGVTFENCTLVDTQKRKMNEFMFYENRSLAGGGVSNVTGKNITYISTNSPSFDLGEDAQNVKFDVRALNVVPPRLAIMQPEKCAPIASGEKITAVVKMIPADGSAENVRLDVYRDDKSIITTNCARAPYGAEINTDGYAPGVYRLAATAFINGTAVSFDDIPFVVQAAGCKPVPVQSSLQIIKDDYGVSDQSIVLSLPGSAVKKILHVETDPADIKRASLKYCMGDELDNYARIAGIRKLPKIRVSINNNKLFEGKVALQYFSKGWHDLPVKPAQLIPGDNSVVFEMLESNALIDLGRDRPMGVAFGYDTASSAKRSFMRKGPGEFKPIGHMSGQTNAIPPGVGELMIQLWIQGKN